MEKVILDKRIEIKEYLYSIDRDIMWLSKKSSIPYSTLYYILSKRERTLTDTNKKKINKVLNTKF